MAFSGGKNLKEGVSSTVGPAYRTAWLALAQAEANEFIALVQVDQVPGAATSNNRTWLKVGLDRSRTPMIENLHWLRNLARFLLRPNFSKGHCFWSPLSRRSAMSD
jgi:hypothetical protein